MKNKLWVSGDACVDLLPDNDQRYIKCAGGAPANVAVAASRLGCNTGFIGRVGDDPFGRFMCSVLKKEQVDHEFMHLDPNHRTSTVVVELDQDGERNFTFMVKPSADQFLLKSDLPEFKAAEWLHICSMALANQPTRSTTFAMIEAIKSKQGFVSFDPNIREDVWADETEILPTILQILPLVDVLKLSEEELHFISQQPVYEDALAWFMAHYQIPLLLITQAERGTLMIRSGVRRSIPSISVSPIDTTGAGDAFVGGLLAGLTQLKHWQTSNALESVVRAANICGALATTAKGAMTALPNKAQLSEQLAKAQQ
jgi:fructokinase